MSEDVGDIIEQARAYRRRWVFLWLVYCALTAFGEWSWLWIIMAMVCTLPIFANSILIINLESSEETT